MNRLLVILSLAVGAWFMWRRYRRLFRRWWGSEAPPPVPKTVTNRPVTLERDPVTGVYKEPKR